ncbi:MAG: HAD family hydrolase [Casimicrobiaceae bacterium]
MRRPEAVLFDFDGTLVDSAPDLAGAVNALRAEYALDPLPYATLRGHATYGARSLLQVGMDVSPDHPDYELLRARFLALYDTRKLALAAPFDGVAELLTALDAQGIRWGIVTNKHSRFALPMIDTLLVARGWRPGVVICGDSTASPKPAPTPLFAAAEEIGCRTDACWYVGDGENDLLAAQAAQMQPILAAWGYLPEAHVAEAWRVRHEALVVEAPNKLISLLATVD